MANLVTCRNHYAMTLSQYTLRKERSLSVYFITYLVVISTKTYTFLASTSLLIICDKNRWSLSKVGFFERVENVKKLYQLIHLISLFCHNVSINSHSQLSASSKKNTHSTSHCKHVEQCHIWGDKTRAAYMLFGYV